MAWIEIKTIKGHEYAYECWREDGRKKRRYLGRADVVQHTQPLGGRPAAAAPVPPNARPERRRQPEHTPATNLIKVGDDLVHVVGPNATDLAHQIYHLLHTAEHP